MPEEPPQNVQCSPLTAESLRMSWDPPPMQSHHGTILGYKIHYKRVNPKSGRKAIIKYKHRWKSEGRDFSQFSYVPLKMVEQTIIVIFYLIINTFYRKGIKNIFLVNVVNIFLF